MGSAHPGGSVKCLIQFLTLPHPGRAGLLGVTHRRVGGSGALLIGLALADPIPCSWSRSRLPCDWGRRGRAGSILLLELLSPWKQRARPAL